MLQSIRLGKKTDLPAAFKRSATLIQKTPLDGKKAVIFLTDGVSSIPYGNEHRLLLKTGVMIHTIGYAKKDYYDKELLQKISTEGKGLHLEANEDLVQKVYESMILKTESHVEDIIFYIPCISNMVPMN